MREIEPIFEKGESKFIINSSPVRNFCGLSRNRNKTTQHTNLLKGQFYGFITGARLHNNLFSISIGMCLILKSLIPTGCCDICLYRQKRKKIEDSTSCGRLPIDIFSFLAKYSLLFVNEGIQLTGLNVHKWNSFSCSHTFSRGTQSTHRSDKSVRWFSEIFILCININISLTSDSNVLWPHINICSKFQDYFHSKSPNFQYLVMGLRLAEHVFSPFSTLSRRKPKPPRSAQNFPPDLITQ